MSTHDKRISALERDVATMKQDFIEKLDDTNHSVTIIKGILGSQEQDIKAIKGEIGKINVRLDRVEIRLDGMDAHFDRVEARLDGIDQRLDGMDVRIGGLTQEMRAVKSQQEQHGEKLDAILDLLKSGRNGH